MKAIILLFFVFLTALSQVAPTPRAPEVYDINLDLPPQERFKEVVLNKKPQIRKLVDALVQTLNVSNYMIKALGFYEQMIYSHQNCYEELLGIAKYSGLTFGETFLLNFIYEIFASCTSIVCVDPNGHIIHARNLDYNFKEVLVDLTVHFRFWRNGTLVYEGDGEAGYLGLVTGLKPGGFGVSINERKKGSYWEAIYEVMVRGTFSIPYFIRKVLENATDFDSAVQMFMSEEFAAPCYLIVSGVKENEGVIITRDISGVANLSRLNSSDPDQWFMVQTNYDRNLPDPASDYRRIPAEERMRKIGRKDVNEQRIYDEVLTLVPNMRPTTILTSVMSPQTGTFNTTVWV